MRKGQAESAFVPFRPRYRRATTATVFALLFGQVLVAAPAGGSVGGCDPKAGGGCLPTPAQCASGQYDGVYEGGYPQRSAQCVSAPGAHIVHYLGGDTNTNCGTIVTGSALTYGVWNDPNECIQPSDAPPGHGGTGKRFREAVSSEHGVVSTESPQAAAVGVKILETGGNAIDAAVATTFALGVTRPEVCGIGGRGMLVYRSADGKIATLDFQGQAPSKIRPDQFVDEGELGGQGVLMRGTGHEVVMVPGTVAGMAAAMEKYGSKSLAEVIAPAEVLAREGFAVSSQLATHYGGYNWPADLNQSLRFKFFPETAKIYLEHGVLLPRPGLRLVQADYAKSLRAIAAEGPKAFYEGKIADLIIADMERSRRDPAIPGDEGVMIKEDLENYEAIWRKPLIGSYRDHQIITMGPPSSGGAFLIEMQNILEGFKFAPGEELSARRIHLIVEAQKLAWADRLAYLADPAYMEPHVVPILTSKGYAKQRLAALNHETAGSYGPGKIPDARQSPPPTTSEGSNTTHISVIDGDGNAVSVTCTLGSGFGSAVVAPGTGFLLNEQVGGFSAPGTPNEPNGGKRPLAAHTPLILVDTAGVPVLLAGGAGSHAIPMSVANTILNKVDFKMDIARAVDATRFSSAECCTITIENYRVPQTTLVELGPNKYNHLLARRGDYSERYDLAVLQAAGIDPISKLRLGSSDTRSSDRGAAPVMDKPLSPGEEPPKQSLAGTEEEFFLTP